MTFPDPDPIKPEPPRWIPPLPPLPEQQAPSIAPAQPELRQTPAPQEPDSFSEKDFLRDRLEALEKELALSRERAASAEASLKQQEATRSEVESYLQSISKQLRSEKAEKDILEEKSNAQGRIAALENRLDEMNRSWLSLIQETLAKARNAPPTQDPTVISGLESDIRKEIKRIGDELKDSLLSWEKRQELEQERAQERLAAIGREREAMIRALGEQNHSIRQEYIKESLRREADLDERIKEMAQALQELRHSKNKNSQEDQELKTSLAKTLSLLSTPPKAKDQIIADMEKEKEDLSKTLHLRTEALQKYTDERRAAEQNLGESLMALHRQLDEERQKRQSLEMRLLDLEADNTRLKIGFEAAQKALKDKDDLYAALCAQRDGLARALLGETEKYREMTAKSRELEEKKANELRLEIEKNSLQNLAITQLREQIAALTAQMTRALGEKEELQTRYGSWDKERADLLRALREKEQMLSMLNSTFKNMLGNP